MASGQYAINATSTATMPNNPRTGLNLVADKHRFFMYIRNYSISAQTLWVAFGFTATPGNQGELELLPGQELVFGNGALSRVTPGAFYYANCPLEFVSVITAVGTAQGCVLTQ